MGVLTALRIFVWEKGGGICDLCGHAVQMADMELDHITPRSEGGPDTIDNLRPTHRACNRHRFEGHPRGPHHANWKGGRGGYALRLPPGLKAKLEAWAQAEHRSLNAQIVYVLEQAAAGAEPGETASDRGKESHAT